VYYLRLISDCHVKIRFVTVSETVTVTLRYKTGDCNSTTYYLDEKGDVP
jgi:hypothetical protein